MTELVWFMFLVWVIFFALSFRFKQPIVSGISGLMGIVLGLELYGESVLLFLMFVILGFYSLYVAAFSEAK